MIKERSKKASALDTGKTADGNEYEARNDEPREISESGTTKSGPHTVLLKIFAQVSKTRRIPDRSGKDQRCMSVSQSQASY